MWPNNLLKKAEDNRVWRFPLCPVCKKQDRVHSISGAPNSGVMGQWRCSRDNVQYDGAASFVPPGSSVPAADAEDETAILVMEDHQPPITALTLGGITLLG
jgi:hypothetical protein